VKRSWVLHECLERVPDDFDAMHELLRYGLRGTDVEAMVALGNRTDNGRSATVSLSVILCCEMKFCWTFWRGQHVRHIASFFLTSLHSFHSLNLYIYLTALV